MNLGQLKTAVRNLLADNINFTPTDPSAVSAQSYSEAQVTEAVNWAAKKYVDKKAFAPNTVATCTRTSTTAKFALPWTLNGPIRVMYVFSGSTRLLDTTLQYERMMNPDFIPETPSNTEAKRWMMGDSGIKEIIVAPGVPTATTSVSAHVVDSPTALAVDADALSTLYVPTAAQEYLKYAAAAWLLQNEGDMQNIQLADKFMDTFNNLIAGTGV